MKPDRYWQVFLQRLLVTVCLVFMKVFLPFPFVFHVGPSSDLKGNGGQVDCASPVHAIGCMCCPLVVVDVTRGERPFQSVFVSFPRSRFVTKASELFSI